MNMTFQGKFCAQANPTNLSVSSDQPFAYFSNNMELRFNRTL